MSPPTATDNVPASQTGAKEVQKGAPKFKFPKPTTYDSLEAERQGRKERLAQAFRVFGHLGFEEGVAGHLTFRDPILKDHFWVNPFGVPFRFMTVSDLLLIGPDGSIVDGGRPERMIYNQAAFAIHHAIHTARPDLDAACHSHSMYGKAFSTLGRNIEITTQDSCAFYKQCALYENFGGVVLADEEGNNIAKALGDKNRALVLQNHGILSAGTSIEAAVGYFIMLEKHCQVMLLSEPAAAARGTKPIVIGHEEAEFTRRQVGSDQALAFQASVYFDTIARLDKGAWKE
ncbi:class II aldolase/adducin domain containing protein [Moesziomyces antarcticus]|uniref:Related to class II aldolase/adducin domain protein n=1 Tax=Pseudozyma antarctica TaxID=84753 RepID=A0A5C3FEI2_PSEA2|nr:class II aldolase/adducin domain containing protein [Moesziomyces antarcticus]GAK62268.1 class II aldolase/adducin domain containing protein [Moesziomyces antarcticus]SPO42808.1 related to class II aldolase/adducin domain protein [Moesziomyces antarcticus]